MKSTYIKEGYYDSWAGCYVQVPGSFGMLFSYSSYSTKKACREAAENYRNKCLKNLPEPRRVFVRVKATRRSKTGILGVHISRLNKRRGRKRTPTLVVVAECKIGPTVKRKQFTVRKYGTRGALEKARIARKALVAQKKQYLSLQ